MQATMKTLYHSCYVQYYR